jgi:hypothetical protein
MLPEFTIVATEYRHGHEDEEGEDRTATSVDVKHDGIVRFEAMVNHPGFEPGMYDVLVNCEEPAGLSMPFNDAFVMDEYGKGKFRAETTLGARSYSGCEASIEEESGRMVIATFDPFRVAEETSHDEDGDERTVDEKRKEARHAILERIVADDIHRRHVDAARASSTGQYEPGMAYNLTSAGTAESHDDEMTVAEVNADVGVWKSNRAIVLMDVLGGSVVVGDDSYTVRVGYALYSLQHDVLRLRALATDDATGEIVSLKLLGAATSDDASFPMTEGEAMELQFEGNSERFSNQIGSWELFLDGSIEA